MIVSITGRNAGSGIQGLCQGDGGLHRQLSGKYPRQVGFPVSQQSSPKSGMQKKGICKSSQTAARKLQNRLIERGVFFGGQFGCGRDTVLIFFGGFI